MRRWQINLADKKDGGKRWLRKKGDLQRIIRLRKKNREIKEKKKKTMDMEIEMVIEEKWEKDKGRW